MSCYDSVAERDAEQAYREAVRDYVVPQTRHVEEMGNFAFALAYDALFRIKVILREQRVPGNHAELLRFIADEFGDIASDWASQWEPGSTEYSCSPRSTAHRHATRRWALPRPVLAACVLIADWL